MGGYITRPRVGRKEKTEETAGTCRRGLGRGQIGSSRFPLGASRLAATDPRSQISQPWLFLNTTGFIVTSAGAAVR